MKEQFKLCKSLGHPFREKGCTDAFSVCKNCGLCITSWGTWQAYIAKYGLHRQGIINWFYRKLYKLR